MLLPADAYCDPYAAVSDPGCVPVPDDPADPNNPPPDPPPEPGVEYDPSTGLTTASFDSDLGLSAVPTQLRWSCQGDVVPPYLVGRVIEAQFIGRCSGTFNYFGVGGSIQKMREFWGFSFGWSDVAEAPQVIRYSPGQSVTSATARCVWSDGYFRSFITMVTVDNGSPNPRVTAPYAGRTVYIQCGGGLLF